MEVPMVLRQEVIVETPQLVVAEVIREMPQEMTQQVVKEVPKFQRLEQRPRPFGWRKMVIRGSFWGCVFPT